MDYRKSLYNHNYFHTSRGINNRYFLGRDKFSFNNIHMNLGNVRYYSFKIKQEANKKSIKDLLFQKSSEDEQNVYNQLAEFFKNLPVNEDTQLKVENFLLNYSNILYNRNKEKRQKFSY